MLFEEASGLRDQVGSLKSEIDRLREVEKEKDALQITARAVQRELEAVRPCLSTAAAHEAQQTRVRQLAEGRRCFTQSNTET
jgi:hypothetical protein